MISSLLHRLHDQLWEREWLDSTHRRLVQIGRYFYAMAHDLLDGQISMRAMSLVYTTLLSIVPMLALAFSVLKALGVHNSLEPLLLQLLAPLGKQAPEVAANIIGFVERIQVGVLGSLGVALLFYTAISMIHKVESSFNFIWRIETGRRFSQRFGEYIAVLMVGPVLVFAALGITATLSSRMSAYAPLGFLVELGSRLLPYVLIIGSFTFLYRFVPNTKVRFKAAFAGGLLSGLLWQSGSMVFASFVATATNYNLIYSGFAIMIFLLFWLYLSWLILLTGCNLAFYVQHPEHLRARRIAPLMSGRGGEFLALSVMSLVGRRYLNAEPALSRDELMKLLDAPPEHVQRTIELLIEQKMLAETGALAQQLVPAMDLETLSLARLWRLARAGNTTQPRSKELVAQAIGKLLDRVEKLVEDDIGELSLRQWLTQQDEDPAAISQQHRPSLKKIRAR